MTHFNTVGAAHHTFRTDLPLQFDAPGHEGSQFTLYFLSQMPEYFAGFIFDISWDLESFSMQCQALQRLCAKSFFIIFFMLSEWQNRLLLTTVTLLILTLNLGSGYFGEWTLRRLETRAFFTAFLLQVVISAFIITYVIFDQLPIG